MTNINLETEEERAISPTRVRTPNLLLWCTFGLCFACFLYREIWSAINTPVWLDEVLSVWVIKMKTAHEIWSAMYKGSEFVPPSYNLFLHYWSQIFGASYLSLRIPSMVGALVFAYCCFQLLRRYLGLPAALLGCYMVLEQVRFYAIQIRPYSVCVALFGIALILWDNLELPNSRWRYFGIFATLALATSIHFYSVFFVPALGLIEVLRWVRARQFRPALWIALFLAGASIAIWLPLIRAFSKYNGGDINSPNFYGQPTIPRILFSYNYLFFGDRVVAIIILTCISLIALAKLWGSEREPEDAPKASLDFNFWAIVLGVSALPFVTWLFSLVTTRNYNDRYVFAAAFGVAALLTGVFSVSPAFRRMVPLLLVMGAALTLTHQPFAWGTFVREPVFKWLANDDLPIVTADAQQFFTLRESAPDYIRSRVFYVSLPTDLKLPDPTVVHQLLRWKDINPKLPVEDVSTFLKLHHDYWMIDTHAGTDDTPLDYFVERGLVNLRYRFPDGTLLLHSTDAPQRP